MKGLLGLCLTIVCAGGFVSKIIAQDQKVYRTYLINESCKSVGYRIENIRLGLTMHAGFLPAKKCLAGSGQGKTFRTKVVPGLLHPSGILKLELPLGVYQICLKFPHETERCFTKMLRKEDYKNSLIPYWEIVSEETDEEHTTPEDNCKSECQGNP